MDIFEILKILATVTGMAYLVMQIFKDRYMWYVYIPSCAMLAIVMFHQKAWAFFALNVYFVIMGFRGLYLWRKEKPSSNAAASSGNRISSAFNQPIHVSRITPAILWTGVGIVALASPFLAHLLSKMGDPYPWLDAVGTLFGAVGTWWLTRSHIEQWVAWIAGNAVLMVMQMKLGNPSLVFMYAFYIVSCILGLWNWRRNAYYGDVPEDSTGEGPKA